MEKFEDRVKTVLERMQLDTQAGMALLAEGQINQVSRFVAAVQGGIKAELPLTINPVLANGGAIRQYTVQLDKGFSSSEVPWVGGEIQVGRQAVPCNMPELALEWGGSVRITIIAEPVPAEKGEDHAGY